LVVLYCKFKALVFSFKSNLQLKFVILCGVVGMVAQRLLDAQLKKELSTVWPNLCQKTIDLLVTPHKRKYHLHFELSSHAPLHNHLNIPVTQREVLFNDRNYVSSEFLLCLCFHSFLIMVLSCSLQLFDEVSTNNVFSLTINILIPDNKQVPKELKVTKAQLKT